MNSSPKHRQGAVGGVPRDQYVILVQTFCSILFCSFLSSVSPPLFSAFFPFLPELPIVPPSPSVDISVTFTSSRLPCAITAEFVTYQSIRPYQLTECYCWKHCSTLEKHQPGTYTQCTGCHEKKGIRICCSRGGYENGDVSSCCVNPSVPAERAFAVQVSSTLCFSRLEPDWFLYA